MSPPNHHLSATGTAKPPPEKSKFLQTCNRLSQFLKEKRNLRDLKINAKLDDTTGVSEAKLTTIDLLSTIEEKPADTIPQYVILDSCCEEQDATKSKAAQMTIFYEGHVLVLDDVPADRARDLMLIAKNGITENRVEKPKPRLDVVGSKEVVKTAEVQAKDSDLPIARRASLHKFLAKRKDRATVRAPYQSPGGSSSGNEHSFDLNM